jgi:hypothetical protein
MLNGVMHDRKLADAMHLLQDQWPIGHRYQPWVGITSGHLAHRQAGMRMVIISN